MSDTSRDQRWLSDGLTALAEAEPSFAREERAGAQVLEEVPPHRRRLVLALAALVVVLVAATVGVVALTRPDPHRAQVATDSPPSTTAATTAPTATTTTSTTVPIEQWPTVPTPRADAFAASVAAQLGPEFKVVQANQTGAGANASLAVNVQRTNGSVALVATSPGYKGMPAVVSPLGFQELPAPEGLQALEASSKLSIHVVVYQPSTGYEVTLFVQPGVGLSTDRLVAIGAGIIQHKP